MHKYAGVLLSSENDHYFSALKLMSGGTTSPRIAKIINFATSLLGPEECYLEVGVFTGYTLCAAGLLNDKKCVGIDNFDMTSVGWNPDADTIYENCLGNLKRLSVNAQLIRSDFRAVEPEQIPGKIGVAFIDGRHEFADVYENLEWLTPKLADDAVVIFDDAGLGAVDIAIRSWWLDKRENFDILAYIKAHYVDGAVTTPIQDQVAHQGLCIMRYQRNGLQ
jgi:predicted O-methyltransferase YrrM